MVGAIYDISGYFTCFGFVCSGETVQVLESVEAATGRARRSSQPDEVCSGAEDERGEFWFVQRAHECEENEEFECGDQVEAIDMVFSEFDKYMSALFDRLAASSLQSYSLRLSFILLDSFKKRRFGGWSY